MIGSMHNIVLSNLNASNTLPEIGTLVNSASFHVALFRGVHRFEQNPLLKKLHNPKNDLISSFGILAVSTAFSLSLPGLIPHGVSLSPR
jgi:hypothetical protein